MENKFFHSEPDEREPYTIVIPPPNVTGVLTWTYVNNTIQDILTRRYFVCLAKMCGSLFGYKRFSEMIIKNLKPNHSLCFNKELPIGFLKRVLFTALKASSKGLVFAPLSIP